MTSTPAKVLIIDDESDARKLLSTFLARFFPGAFIVNEASGVQHGLSMLKETPVDLMFLDIEMEDGTGFDLLDRLPEIRFPIIFITAHDEFAIKAFRYNAVDYLLKPIDPDEFVAAVTKAQQFTDRNQFQSQFRQLLQTAKEKSFNKITLSTGTGLVFTHTMDISRIETYGNYSFVFMKSGERLLVSKNLKEFEEMLPEPDFFRIHQSHIVNTSFVRKFVKGEGDHVVMEDEAMLPVSRRRKEEFLTIMNRLRY
jgi:two-component system LytT family response regulator